MRLDVAEMAGFGAFLCSGAVPGCSDTDDVDCTLQGMIRRCSVTNVASIPKASELANLSVSDRLDLMDEIWASLELGADSIPLPEWHLVEIKRRLTNMAEDGNRGRSAEEVFAELKRRL
jgi:putative addiction module component (TIGR02574 family)